eukprot:s1500_g8.t1
MVGSQQAGGPCDDVRKVFVTRRVASGGAQARCSGPLRMFPTSLWDMVPWLCISDPAATRKKSALAFAAYSKPP